MLYLYLAIFLTTASMTIDAIGSCNEAMCASVVSKCMLTQSCKCDLKNCSCCKECFNCLGELYSDCCSCVDMCPERNYIGSSLSKKSYVEDFPDPQTVLFSVLTAEPDTLERWVTYNTAIDIDSPLNSKFNKHFKYNHIYEDRTTKDVAAFNCTVAYITQCVSWNKCRMVCQSMGSSAYRWFHDGCCECIGHSCINYGINENRCPKCPLKEVDDEDVDEYYNSLDSEELPEEQTLK
ncbi:Protein twisted gastrulation [Gryllus bimaculatus]|nr:Protein twisted gastrulation [Gryllus bimaculatus]